MDISDKKWVNDALGLIEADQERSADTHLIRLVLPGFPDIPLYLKDESSHPTGSLKHRLARSLFLYSLCNGWIKPGHPVIEASSGSTAVSEAYFARLIGVPFVAVMPRTTSPEKIALIEFYGGRCHFVDKACEVYAVAQRLADQTEGHYMDQFSYAERATDWKGPGNIAQSIFQQMRKESYPVPRWIVCAAGTGGTGTLIGRYLSYQGLPSQLCVADPENSVFYDYFRTGDANLTVDQSPRIEGIGRPRVEASFVREVVDAMVKVPDVYSVAAIHYLSQVLGRRVGGSTGTIFSATLALMRRMQFAGEQGSVAMVLCDGGDRYAHSYYDPVWLEHNGFDVESLLPIFRAAAEQGQPLGDWESSLIFGRDSAATLSVPTQVVAGVV
jgi:cysteine synthase